MADYLMALAVGPVQGFIAAARRTRDLWFGSWVLSEVSKAAAREWAVQGARLVFPAPLAPEELEPGSGLNVGNKILAVAGGIEPRVLLERAKEAAGKRWRRIADSAREKLRPEAIDGELWRQQVGEVLEMYGAWVAIGDGPDVYRQARARVEHLLGARKATRDFSPGAVAFGAEPGFGKRKSSLDAARESVFTNQMSRRDRRLLHLGKSEHLDCPGLVKRVAGDPERFPSAARIALEPWLEKIPDEALQPALLAHEPFVGLGLASRVKTPRFSKVPFDGVLFFPTRLEAECRNLPDDERDATTDSARCGMQKARDALHEQFGVPTPYFAVLVADGDHMGRFIDARNTAEDHMAVTRALAGFARRAQGIVEEHQGACVYAGGDDVLALLPLHRTLACAGALNGAFGEAVRSLGAGGSALPTLSAGLGIGHFLTPFPRLLDLGRRAERLAKDGPVPGTGRNALAIIVGVRSGAESWVQGGWDSGIAERLARWIGCYAADRLSDKTAYDLREAAARMAWAKGRDDYAEIAAGEARRVLARKRVEGGAAAVPPEVVAEIETAIRSFGLEAVVQELIVARWLAQKGKA